MLAKFPGAPVPSAGKFPRPSEFRAVVPPFSFPVSSVAGIPRYLSSMSADLAHCFAADDQCVGDLRDMHALKRDAGSFSVGWREPSISGHTSARDYAPLR